jgi:hypothetical protein
MAMIGRHAETEVSAFQMKEAFRLLGEDLLLPSPVGAQRSRETFLTLCVHCVAR